MQTERLAEAIDQIAPIGCGYSFGLVAMDYHDRRIAAALMSVAQFDSAAVYFGRLMLLYRLFQYPRQFRRRKFALCIGIRAVDRFDRDSPPRNRAARR